MSTNRVYEITFVDPMSDSEFEFWASHACRDGSETSLSHSNRILLLETDIDVNELISMLARLGFADDVGLIRETIEYVPEREMVVLEFTNDK